MQRQKTRTPRAHISFACPLWVLPCSPMRDEAITYVRNRETQASSPLRSAECGTLVLPTQGAGYHSFTRPLHLLKKQKTKDKRNLHRPSEGRRSQLKSSQLGHYKTSWQPFWEFPALRARYRVLPRDGSVRTTKL